MGLSIDQLEVEALELTPEAREQLAQRLLRSLKPTESEHELGEELSEAHPVEKIRGLLGSGQHTDELIEAMRGR